VVIPVLYMIRGNNLSLKYDCMYMTTAKSNMYSRTALILLGCVHCHYCTLKYLVLFLASQSLLADEQLASCPVLLLGNKIDIPGAASEDYIRQYFGLYGLTTGKVQCT